MEKQVKRIGVLTSGGDAPGMNSAVRAVVRSAASRGIDCVGIRRGWNGLISSDFVRMDTSSVSHIINKGGTLLYTARSDEFREVAGQDKALATCKLLGLDDIGCSHYTIGFDTACNTAIECIDKLRDTMQSHERCSVVEVMGRHAGYLALYVGISVGATAVLIPEREVNFEQDVVEKIRRARLAGTTHYMVVVAEGAGNAMEISSQIKEEIGLDPRVTVLGHIQRGGAPSARDRETASRMGYMAVKAISENAGNCVVATQEGRMVVLEMEEALAMKKQFNMDRYDILEALTNNYGGR